jgi:hypothetical protein
MPGHVPPVQELGITSAPLKSASFAMGTFCKEYTGQACPPFLLLSPSGPFSGRSSTRLSVADARLCC